MTKIVAMVLYKLAKGVDYVELDFLFAHGSSTMYKFTLLVFHVLVHKDKVVKIHISISLGVRLANVIEGFHNITSEPNMCAAKGRYKL